LKDNRFIQSRIVSKGYGIVIFLDTYKDTTFDRIIYRLKNKENNQEENIKDKQVDKSKYLLIDNYEYIENKTLSKYYEYESNYDDLDKFMNQFKINYKIDGEYKEFKCFYKLEANSDINNVSNDVMKIIDEYHSFVNDKLNYIKTQAENQQVVHTEQSIKKSLMSEVDEDGDKINLNH